ncbi:unnamed protein product [Vitrella brassicaformis CCMP3155]|uniref:Uncharacterized protein n=6 Tax=Vitrella brassicaformis TaxID=1169539 RepID=A0A0G4EWT1_VITBC|nr:unnamed protein product [Vitrella brassicaformis CCMP3155]|eukprot:CEM02724.1 unnamed protein product [Vitrella brassicaformis CCMP3155]
MVRFAAPTNRTGRPRRTDDKQNPRRGKRKDPSPGKDVAPLVGLAADVGGKDGDLALLDSLERAKREEDRRTEEMQLQMQMQQKKGKEGDGRNVHLLHPEVVGLVSSLPRLKEVRCTSQAKAMDNTEPACAFGQYTAYEAPAASEVREINEFRLTLREMTTSVSLSMDMYHWLRFGRQDFYNSVVDMNANTGTVAQALDNLSQWVSACDEETPEGMAPRRDDSAVDHLPPDELTEGTPSEAEDPTAMPGGAAAVKSQLVKAEQRRAFITDRLYRLWHAYNTQREYIQKLIDGQHQPQVPDEAAPPSPPTPPQISPEPSPGYPHSVSPRLSHLQPEQFADDPSDEWQMLDPYLAMSMQVQQQLQQLQHQDSSTSTTRAEAPARRDTAATATAVEAEGEEGSENGTSRPAPVSATRRRSTAIAAWAEILDKERAAVFKVRSTALGLSNKHRSLRERFDELKPSLADAYQQMTNIVKSQEVITQKELKRRRDQIIRQGLEDAWMKRRRLYNEREKCTHTIQRYRQGKADLVGLRAKKKEILQEIDRQDGVQSTVDDTLAKIARIRQQLLRCSEELGGYGYVVRVDPSTMRLNHNFDERPLHEMVDRYLQKHPDVLTQEPSHTESDEDSGSSSSASGDQQQGTDEDGQTTKEHKERRHKRGRGQKGDDKDGESTDTIAGYYVSVLTDLMSASSAATAPLTATLIEASDFRNLKRCLQLLLLGRPSVQPSAEGTTAIKRMPQFYKTQNFGHLVGVIAKSLDVWVGKIDLCDTYFFASTMGGAVSGWKHTLHKKIELLSEMKESLVEANRRIVFMQRRVDKILEKRIRTPVQRERAAEVQTIKNNVIKPLMSLHRDRFVTLVDAVQQLQALYDLWHGFGVVNEVVERAHASYGTASGGLCRWAFENEGAEGGVFYLTHREILVLKNVGLDMTAQIIRSTRDITGRKDDDGTLGDIHEIADLLASVPAVHVPEELTAEERRRRSEERVHRLTMRQLRMERIRARQLKQRLLTVERVWLLSHHWHVEGKARLVHLLHDESDYNRTAEITEEEAMHVKDLEYLSIILEGTRTAEAQLYPSTSEPSASTLLDHQASSLRKMCHFWHVANGCKRVLHTSRPPRISTHKHSLDPFVFAYRLFGLDERRERGKKSVLLKGDEERIDRAMERIKPKLRDLSDWQEVLRKEHHFLSEALTAEELAAFYDMNVDMPDYSLPVDQTSPSRSPSRAASSAPHEPLLVDDDGRSLSSDDDTIIRPRGEDRSSEASSPPDESVSSVPTDTEEESERDDRKQKQPQKAAGPVSTGYGLAFDWDKRRDDEHAMEEETGEEIEPMEAPISPPSYPNYYTKRRDAVLITERPVFRQTAKEKLSPKKGSPGKKEVEIRDRPWHVTSGLSRLRAHHGVPSPPKAQRKDQRALSSPAQVYQHRREHKRMEERRKRRPSYGVVPEIQKDEAAKKDRSSLWGGRGGGPVTAAAAGASPLVSYDRRLTVEEGEIDEALHDMIEYQLAEDEAEEQEDYSDQEGEGAYESQAGQIYSRRKLPPPGASPPTKPRGHQRRAAQRQSRRPHEQQAPGEQPEEYTDEYEEEASPSSQQQSSEQQGQTRRSPRRDQWRVTESGVGVGALMPSPKRPRRVAGTPRDEEGAEEQDSWEKEDESEEGGAEGESDQRRGPEGEGAEPSVPRLRVLPAAETVPAAFPADLPSFLRSAEVREDDTAEAQWMRMMAAMGIDVTTMEDQGEGVGAGEEEDLAGDAERAKTSPAVPYVPTNGERDKGKASGMATKLLEFSTRQAGDDDASRDAARDRKLLLLRRRKARLAEMRLIEKGEIDPTAEKLGEDLLTTKALMDAAAAAAAASHAPSERPKTEMASHHLQRHRRRARIAQRDRKDRKPVAADKDDGGEEEPRFPAPQAFPFPPSPKQSPKQTKPGRLPVEPTSLPPIDQQQQEGEGEGEGAEEEADAIDWLSVPGRGPTRAIRKQTATPKRTSPAMSDGLTPSPRSSSAALPYVQPVDLRGQQEGIIVPCTEEEEDEQKRDTRYTMHGQGEHEEAEQKADETMQDENERRSPVTLAEQAVTSQKRHFQQQQQQQRQIQRERDSRVRRDMTAAAIASAAERGGGRSGVWVKTQEFDESGLPVLLPSIPTTRITEGLRKTHEGESTSRTDRSSPSRRPPSRPSPSKQLQQQIPLPPSPPSLQDAAMLMMRAALSPADNFRHMREELRERQHSFESSEQQREEEMAAAAEQSPMYEGSLSGSSIDLGRDEDQPADLERPLAAERLIAALKSPWTMTVSSPDTLVSSNGITSMMPSPPQHHYPTDQTMKMMASPEADIGSTGAPARTSSGRMGMLAQVLMADASKAALKRRMHRMRDISALAPIRKGRGPPGVISSVGLLGQPSGGGENGMQGISRVSHLKRDGNILSTTSGRMDKPHKKRAML